MRAEFDRGFVEELEKISQWQIILPEAVGLGLGAGFAGHDLYKGFKEHAVSGPRSEEAKATNKLTKLPPINPLLWPHWGLGRGAELVGRTGETPLHKYLSLAGAGTGAMIDLASPTTAIRKMIPGRY